MLKRPHFIALGVVVVLALVLLNLPGRIATQLKAVLGSVFLPLFGLAHSTQSLSQKATSVLWPRRTLLAELERLRADNDRLLLGARNGEEIERENQQLREQVGWRKRSPAQMKLARVIGRVPSNWWRAILIDLGSRDGIGLNYAVVTPLGLVGRVAEVSYQRSLVILVGDPNCRVAARLETTREVTGIIVPSSSEGLDTAVVALTHLHRNSEAKPGHKVLTSGQGGLFPKGIPIGQVIDARPVEFGMYLEARVRLAVDLNGLEMVWVLYP